jgi:Xaa-Pro aminopeptidase
MSHLKRIEKVQNLLKERFFDFFVVEDVKTILYLTGFHLTFGKFIISQSSFCLFVDERYIEKARKSFLECSLLKEELIKEFFFKHSKEKVKVTFDSELFSYNSFEKLVKFLEKSKIVFKIIPIPNFLKVLRSIKTEDEILALKKAADLNKKGFFHICKILREGISEKEIALEFEIFCRVHGAEKMAFDPIVSFAENSAMPHHRPTTKVLKKDDIVLMDFGVVCDNYCSDMTRVLFFGEGDPVLKRMYSLVKKAHLLALNLCYDGIKIGKIDEEVRNFFKKEGVEEEFIHALGHGVGLDVHEYPKVKFDGLDKNSFLKKGMVIAIEPALYKRGVGGVRYEDTILITEKGYENFYTSSQE